MRGLSSRNVRPSLAQRHLLHTCTPVRRTFLLPNGRRFNAADAFSILLAPILTTAFIFDTTAKQDKSRELDRQIAAVEAETERLREQQIKAWTRLQKRSVSNGAWQQKRAFSTAAQAVAVQDDMEDPMDHDVSGQDPEEDEVRTPLNTGLSPDVLSQVQLFDRLIATRLALQLLLQLKSGSSTAYAMPIETAPHYHYTENHHSFDYILAELAKVGRMLHGLYRKNLPYGANHPDDYLEKRNRLSLELTDLTDRYRKSDVHLPEFVMSYMNMIAKYQMGPPVANYVEIMRVFQKMNIMPMAVIAESAVWEAQQYLDNKAVSSILFCHGTDMDAYRLKDFLKRMTRSDLFPRPEKKWYEMQLEDFRLATPASKNPWVIVALIRASLCCQQFTIAEAYAQEFLRRDAQFRYEGRFKCWLSTAFLATYSRVASWKSGLKWINQAILWMADILSNGIERGEHLLGRCVLRMMEYCVVCDKSDVYEELLQAVVASGIPCPPLDTTKPISVTKRVHQIRLDWQLQAQAYCRTHEAREPSLQQELVSEENLRQFQQKLWYIFGLPQGGVRPSKERSHKVFRQLEELDPAEELSSMSTPRFKSIHQSPGTRTTTLPFMPPIIDGVSEAQPEQYVFAPHTHPHKTKDTEEAQSEVFTSKASNAMQDFTPLPVLKNKKIPFKIPGTDITSPQLIHQSAPFTPANSSAMKTSTSATPPSQPMISIQPERPLESSYESFWPHMSISGDPNMDVTTATSRIDNTSGSPQSDGGKIINGAPKKKANLVTEKGNSSSITRPSSIRRVISNAGD